MQNIRKNMFAFVGICFHIYVVILSLIFTYVTKFVQISGFYICGFFTFDGLTHVK